MIVIDQVSKTFVTSRGRTAALSAISLEIGDGEFTCLVGPSGCGKTTLLHLMAGLEHPNSGEVRIDDRRVTGPGSDRGVLFQEAALFPWLTVEQNVEFGIRQERLPARTRRDRTTRYLEMVGMSRFAASNVYELSGGMRQRVALARALALEPGILLMDEPFGALDALSREALQAELVEVWRSTQKTIVFVTHDVAEAVRLGSRVIVLGARPARVRFVVDVEAMLPRPRAIDQPQVVDLATRLRQGLVKEDALGLASESGEPAQDPERARDRALLPWLGLSL